jgi:ABC-type glycerol-3-phosphate transport system substrate-binding protein
MPGLTSTIRSAALSRRAAIAQGAILSGAAALAACRPGGGEGTRTPERKPVELYMTTWTNQLNIPVWDQAVESFNKRFADQKLSVRMEHIPDSYYDKLKVAYAAGSAPDVVYTNPAEAQQIALQGVLIDLMPIIKSDKFNLDDINPPAQRPWMWDGKVFGLA